MTPENIVQKVADASGAKYSAASASVSQPPKPPTTSKPAFNPTRSAGGSGFNPLAGRSRPGYAEKDVDADGWGADAPQVSRSQLEKVQPAYKPTKVNMAELTKQHQPSSYQPSTAPESNPDVVKGGYQPIGKVDIAALRAQAKNTDDRPTTVKGAYEPVGKVDIAAIRARAQKPTDNEDRRAAPPSSTADDASRSLADRSTAFSQSERITSMPKPKVGNKFGASTGSFGGTKAPTPGGYGQAGQTTAPAPVGAASRTFADEGGKTPAQIWAEKKARERGQSGAADTGMPATAGPIKSQSSGTNEWKSGYTGKSWAPVATTHTGHSGSGGNLEQQRTGEQTQEQDAPASPSGGIAALKDRFVGGAPMGAPATAPAREASPPPLPSSSRPAGGVAMPGLPTRGRPDAEESSSSGPNIPPPPPVQRSPTPSPERESSPVRVAMPVARGREASIEAPAERHDVPALPVSSMVQKLPAAKDEERAPAGHDPARVAGVAVAAATFGAAAAIATTQQSEQGGKRAVILYDYEKAEDNEVELVEGEFVSNIDMVDEDWWMGTNARGESGLFPSNYVELVEGEEEEASTAESRAPPPAPAAAVAEPAQESADEGVRATAQFDYEAAEDNELSFPEGAIIEQVVRNDGAVGRSSFLCWKHTSKQHPSLLFKGGC